MILLVTVLRDRLKRGAGEEAEDFTITRPMEVLTWAAVEVTLLMVKKCVPSGVTSK